MDDELSRILRDLIRVGRSRRSTSTKAIGAEVGAQFGQSGGSRHSSYGLLLDRRFAAEFEERAHTWLSLTRRVISEVSLPWTKQLGEEIEHLLREELVKDSNELVALLRDTGQRGAKIAMNELDDARDRVKVELSAEIALSVYAEDQSRIPVADQLLAARYRPVLPSWKKAHDFLNGASVDNANAAKEAVSAVEQLARIVIGDPKAKLGDAIKILRNKHQVEPPLLKGLEEIWGWASNKPSVRHGSMSGAVVNPDTARYVVMQAAAAMGLLLSVDAA